MTRAQSSCAIVGVGASAGGLDAFRRLLGALPAGVPLAFVLVQHLDPSRESKLADVLASACSLPVIRAEDSQTVEPGHVYVIPEGAEASLVAGKLRLRPEDGSCRERIDVFLSSLAANSEARGCGVLLSGQGSDGVQGLREIRGAGGITLVQDPTTAEYEGMPRAAIASRVADFVGAPERIADELVQLASHFRSVAATDMSKAEQEREQKTLGQIVATVRESTGMDFSGYKTTTVLRRVGRRAMLHDIDGLDAYLELLSNDPTEVTALLDDLLINVTQFFRDPEVFDTLRTRVFPEMLAQMTHADTLRLWVAGCSTGEEVYGILITLLEALDGSESKPKITVFGTDASEDAVRAARTGAYPASACLTVSPERLSRFFVRTADGFEIHKTLREMCIFARQDITKDTPFSRLDLVSLRNVLIYMDRELQNKVLAVAHYSLSPSGFLVLGTSETPESDPRLFAAFDKKHHLYRRKDVAPRLPLDVTGTMRLGMEAVAVSGHAGEVDPVEFDMRVEADEMALLLYAPTRVVVDADGQVLQFFGDTTSYLGHAEGRATFDLLEMARPELLLDLREALAVAESSGRPASRDAAFISDGREQRVSVEVTPLPSAPGQSRRLVAFREMPLAPAAVGGGSADEDLMRLYEAREQRLRREITALRAQLRTGAEEKDRANQSLREANEDVRSSNEELQSINEEMETAREELQSANEELITVNEELRQSNRDLALANDDLGNFMSSTQLPVLMLDCELKVRRFTPQASSVVHIVPADEGRPLNHLRFRVDVPDLEETARTVIAGGETLEREVVDDRGHWYSLRILPYRSAEGLIEGAVLAFIDVHDLKTGLQRIERRAQLSEALNEIETAIASTLEFDEIMQRAIDNGARALGADAGTIEIREADEWTIRYQHGLRPSDVGTRLSDAEAPVAVRAATTLEPQVTVDTGTDSESEGWARSIGMTSILAAPLVIKGVATGCILFLCKGEPHEFNRAEVDFARRLAAGVAFAVENARLFEAEHHAAQLSAALNKINEILMSALTPPDVLARLVGEVSEIAGADKCLVIEVRGDQFVITHVRNVRDDLVGQPMNGASYAAFALAAAERRPILIEDNWTDPRTNKKFVIPYELRAFHLIPLIVDDEVFGVIAFAYDAPRIFDDQDVEFAENMATAMSLAMKNARLFETEQRELARTTVLRTVAAIGASTLDLKELAEGALATAHQLLGATTGNLFVLDEDARAMRSIANFGIPDEALALYREVPLDSETASAQVALTGRVITHDAETLPEATERTAKVTGAEESGWVILPVNVRGKTLGTLGLSFGPRGGFEEDEVSFLQSLADQLGVAMEKAQLFEAEQQATRQATQELQMTAALLDAAEAIADWTDLAEVVCGLAKNLLSATSHSRVTIDLWHEVARELEIVASEGEMPLPQGARYSIDVVTAATRASVLERRTGVVDFDVASSQERSAALDEYQSHLSLYVPLVQHDKVVGLIVVDDPGERREFGSREIDLIDGIASQAAVAIESARLFAAERDSRARADAQARRLAVLKQVADIAASTLDVYDLGQCVADAVPDLLGASVVTVMFEDATETGLVPVGSVGYSEEYLARMTPAPADSEVMIVYRSGTARWVADLEAVEASKATTSRSRGPGIRSFAMLPLLSGGRAIGTFSAAWPKPHSFAPDEVAFLESFAAEVAVGLQNARLFEAEAEAQRLANHELEMTTLLLQTSEALASVTDLDATLKRLAAVVLEAVAHARVTVNLWDDELREVRTVASIGVEPMTPATFTFDQLSDLGRESITMRESRVIDYATVGDDETRRIAEERGLHLALGVPLVFRGRVLGTIAVDSPGVRREFSEREIQLVEGVAAQAAAAIANAQLFEGEAEAQRRAARELATTTLLLEAATTLAESSDLGSGLERLVERMRLAIPGARAVVYALDAPRMEVRVLATGGGAAPPVGAHLPLSGMTRAGREMFASGKSSVVDFDALPEDERGFGERFGVHRLLAVPTVYQDRIVGALVVDDPAEPRREFGEREIEIIEAFAAQVAAAIDNDDHLQAEMKRAVRLQTLQDLTELVSSSLDMDAIVAVGMERIIELLDVRATSLWVLTPDGARLQLAGNLGFTDGFAAEFAEGLPLDAPHDVVRAVVSGEPVVHADASSSDVARPVREAYQRHGIPLGSLIALPLQTPSGRIGGLTLAWEDARQFTDEDIDFDTSIATAFATALENARLFEVERTLHAAEEERRSYAETLNRVNAIVHSSFDLDALLERVTVDAGSALNFGGAAIMFHEAGVWRIPYRYGIEDEAAMAGIPDRDAPLAARIVETPEIVVVDDAQNDPRVNSENYRRFGVKGVIIVPLMARGDVESLLFLTLPQDRDRFTEAQADFAKKLGSTISLAVENARLNEVERERLVRIETLHELTDLAVSSLDAQEVAQRAFTFMTERLDVTYVNSFIHDSETDRLKFLAGVGGTPAYYEEVGEGFALDSPFDVATVFAAGAPVVHESVTGEGAVGLVADLFERSSMPLETYAVLPLQSRTGTVGVLALAWAKQRLLAEGDLDFYMSLANELATALSNARLFEEVRSSNERVTEILTSMTDGFVAVDGDWRYVLVNPAAERMLHKTAPELLGNKLPEVFPDINGLPMYRKAMEQRVPVAFETYSEPTDAWVEVHVYPTGSGLSILAADISVRKTAEEAVRRQNAVLQGANRIFEAGLQTETGEALGEACLQVAQELTDSAFGFIGEINEQGKLSDLAMSDVAWANCAMYDQTGHRRPPGEFAIHGIYGRVLVDGGNAFWTNQPGSHPDSVGLPEGHALVESFLGVPLIAGGQVLGMIGLANREGGFTDDQLEIAQGIAPAIVEAIQRKRAEQRLSDATMRLDAHITNSPLAIVEFDSEFRLTRWSVEAERMFGWTASEVLGKAIGELHWVYEEDAELVERESAGLFTGATPRHLNTNRNYTKDGSVIWCEWYSSAFYDEEGHLVSVLSQILNITSRREAQEARETLLSEIETERGRLREIIEDIPVGVALVDANGAVLEVNEATDRIWAGDLPKAESVEGYAVYDGYHRGTGARLKPDEWPAPRAIASGERAEETVEIIRLDGAKATIRVDAIPIKNAEDKVARVVVITEDVTERLQAERLREAVGAISASASSTFDTDEILHRVLTGAAEALGMESSAVVMRRGRDWVVKEVLGAGQVDPGRIFTAEQFSVDPSILEQWRPIAIDSADEPFGAKLLSGLGIRSILLVPLVARGEVIGVMAFSNRERARPFTTPEVEFASSVMSVVTLALDNAALYERERNIADTLQEAMLVPPEPVSDLEISYVYRPASAAANVGGDFYDVFGIDDERVGILIGDVSGKGLEAARHTSLIRSGARAYALEDAEPDHVLANLNMLVHRSTPVEAFATVFFGVLDRVTGVLRYGGAGHPAGLVIRQAGAIEALNTRPPIVGAFRDAGFGKDETQLAPGDLLVLFTDGLIEARLGNEMFGEERTLEAVRSLSGSSVADLPQELLDEVLKFSEGKLRDDVVILCIMRTPSA